MRRRTLALTFAALWPAAALSQIPSTLTYQGRLMDGAGVPKAGPVDVQFAVFDAVEAGNLVWCEAQKLALNDGYYATTLGSGTACTPPTTVALDAAFAGANRFLEISVGGVPLRPRQSVSSVPFAFTAASLDHGDRSYVQNQTAGPQAANFKISGSGALGGAAGTAQLHVKGAPAVNGTGTAVVNNGSATVTGVGSRFTSEVSPGDMFNVSAGGATCSARVIAVANDASLTLDAPCGANITSAFAVQKPVARINTNGGGSAALIVNGQGNVGLGTETPAMKLDVQGGADSVEVARFYSTHPQGTYLRLQSSNSSTKWGIAAGGNSGWSNDNFTIDQWGVAPRLKINPSGKVGIGTDPGSAMLQVNGGIMSMPNPSGDKFAAGFIGPDETTSNIWQLHFHGDTARLWNGTAEVVLATSTSSRRWKTNVEPLSDSLNTLMKLQGVRFRWVPDLYGGKRDIGFVAEEVGKVIPELVTWDDDGTKASAVDYGHLTALTVEGIKEQQKEIATLKSENVELRERVKALEEAMRMGGGRAGQGRRDDAGGSAP